MRKGIIYFYSPVPKFESVYNCDICIGMKNKLGGKYFNKFHA